MRLRAGSWASGKAIDELSARETEACEQLLIVSSSIESGS
jgi:hypothetical protein